MFELVTDYLEDLKESIIPSVAFAADEDVEEHDADASNDGEDEEEEEEDEETADQLDALREECKNTSKGQELVHHYMECAERVQKAQEQPGYEDLDYKEDCVEEFFHLQHYLDSCAAPRLFNKLK